MKINIKKLREIMRNPNIKPIEKCVLVDLMLYAGDDKNDKPFPSQKTIAKDLGFSARYIRECLIALREKHLIPAWKRRGYSKSNAYTLNEELYFHNDKTAENTSSSQIGSSVPLYSGTTAPPNISQESNQISSSYVQQLFEKVAEKKCHGTDIKQLDELCSQYTPQWVYDAIKEAANRHITYLTPAYIALILGDWKREGKPEKRPTYVACGKDGCTGGYILNTETNTARVCECRASFEEKLHNWQIRWGNRK